MRIRSLPALASLPLLLLQAQSALAQARDTAAGLPPTNQAIFAPLDLPDPDDYRIGTGAPGPEYWQQEADYRIRVSLDTTAHRVTGSETLTYVNNSPDSLSFLWMQLEQNLFSPESRGALINSGDRARWRGSFEGGGVHLDSLFIEQGG